MTGRGKSIARRQLPVSKFQIFNFRSLDTLNPNAIDPSVEAEANDSTCPDEDDAVEGDEFRVENEGSKERTEKLVLLFSSTS